MNHTKGNGLDAANDHPAKTFTQDVNDLNFPTGQRESKAFATLAARFALAGHTFTRSNPADGAVLYYATRWGLSRALDDLDAARQFLTQIGGSV